MKHTSRKKGTLKWSLCCSYKGLQVSQSKISVSMKTKDVNLNGMLWWGKHRRGRTLRTGSFKYIAAQWLTATTHLATSLLKFSVLTQFREINILPELLGLKKQKLASLQPFLEKKKKNQMKLALLRAHDIFIEFVQYKHQSLHSCMCFNSKPRWRCKLIWSTHHKNISTS